MIRVRYACSGIEKSRAKNLECRAEMLSSLIERTHKDIKWLEKTEAEHEKYVKEVNEAYKKANG